MDSNLIYQFAMELYQRDINLGMPESLAKIGMIRGLQACIGHIVESEEDPAKKAILLRSTVEPAIRLLRLRGSSSIDPEYRDKCTIAIQMLNE